MAINNYGNSVRYVLAILVFVSLQILFAFYHKSYLCCLYYCSNKTESKSGVCIKITNTIFKNATKLLKNLFYNEF